MPGTADFAADPLARPQSWPAPIDRHMAQAVRQRALDALDLSAPLAADPDGSAGDAPSTAMADIVAVLWARFLKFDAADPHWPDRDRFVLSGKQGTGLLEALLDLTGQPGSWANGAVPAAPIEAAAGTWGQGLSTAVGLALAERMLAARFGRSLVDHRTWVILSDGDLMEGSSHEAIGLAGDLRLDKLTVLFDDTAFALNASDAAGSLDEPLRRFTSLGWTVKRVDALNPAEVAAALSFAQRSRKPTLIACRTTPAEGQAAITDDVIERWQAAGRRGASTRRAWLKRLARHPQRGEFERVVAGRLPDGWSEAAAALKTEMVAIRPATGSRQSSHRVLDALMPCMPELVGGSTETSCSDLTGMASLPPIGPGNYGGRFIHFGGREHGMAAAANGMALHGGLIPYGATSLIFADYMRPALRLGAHMRQRVLHVLTQDQPGPPEGAGGFPIEHLASLRAVPGLFVFRPADAIETAECWELALRRADSPSVVILTREALPMWRTDASENRSARGGYVLAPAPGETVATLIATGADVGIAMQARELLAAEGLPVAVVSLPCWELFALQDESYRAEVLGDATRFGIEAASGFGWERWLGTEGVFIGISGHGVSAPYEDCPRPVGIMPEAVVAAVRKRLFVKPDHQH